MMNYGNYVIQNLLNKYERSKGFKTGVFTQKIILTVAKDKQLTNRLEIAEEKECFLEMLASLKAKGLVDFSWVKYEQNNLVERIWLNLAKVKDAYAYVGRRDKKGLVSELYQLVQEGYNCCYKQTGNSDISVFLAEELEKMAETKGETVFFYELDETNAVLKALIWLNKNDDKASERLLSIELYNDSKYFERHVKGKVLSILRHINKSQGYDTLSDEDLLLEYGLSRWPEIYEFIGNIKVEVLSEEQTVKFIDYSSCLYGAYIDSTTVSHISNIRADNIDRVLFIENKANYEWYKSKIKSNELIVFHGGHYSLMKGKWFAYLYNAIKQQNPQAEFYHWSDIDFGGFNIFVRLHSLLPELQPYKMDLETYEKFVDMRSKDISDEYMEKLKRLLNDEKFSAFHDVIKAILQKGKTLEQEQIIARDYCC